MPSQAEQTAIAEERRAKREAVIRRSLGIGAKGRLKHSAVRHQPTGSIVRATARETVDKTLKLVLSPQPLTKDGKPNPDAGETRIVRVLPDKQERGYFRDYCRKHGIGYHPCEYGVSERSRYLAMKSGKSKPTTGEVPISWYVVGTPEALDLLCKGGHTFLRGGNCWEYALSSSVPQGTPVGQGTFTPASKRRTQEGKREAIARAEDRSIERREPGLSQDDAIRSILMELGYSRDDEAIAVGGWAFLALIQHMRLPDNHPRRNRIELALATHDESKLWDMGTPVRTQKQLAEMQTPYTPLNGDAATCPFSGEKIETVRIKTDPAEKWFAGEWGNIEEDYTDIMTEYGYHGGKFVLHQC